MMEYPILGIYDRKYWKKLIKKPYSLQSEREYAFYPLYSIAVLSKKSKPEPEPGYLDPFIIHQNPQKDL